MDWLDLLAVQGTLTSLLQHHSSKAKGAGYKINTEKSLRFIELEFIELGFILTKVRLVKAMVFLVVMYGC